MLGNSLDAWLAAEENALRQESKMVVSKQRVLINYFIAKATEKAAENDQMGKNCFVRIGSLFHYAKSKADNLTKPQEARSKIIALDFCAEDTDSQNLPHLLQPLLSKKKIWEIQLRTSLKTLREMSIMMKTS